MLAEHDDTAFAGLAREFDVEWAVTRASLSETFGELLARDPRPPLHVHHATTAVYVRRHGLNGSLATDGYRWLRHLTSPGEALAVAMSGVRADDLAHDGALARAQAPGSVRAAFLDACGAVAAKDQAKLMIAVAALEGLGGDPSLVAALQQAWEAPRCLEQTVHET